MTNASIFYADLDILEAFVCILHDNSTPTFGVNEARFELLTKKQRVFNAILGSELEITSRGYHIKVGIYRGKLWHVIRHCFVMKTGAGGDSELWEP